MTAWHLEKYPPIFSSETERVLLVENKISQLEKLTNFHVTLQNDFSLPIMLGNKIRGL